MGPVRHRSRRPPPSWPPGTSGPRILVETAEPRTGSAYEELLGSIGFEVLTCGGPYARGGCPLLCGDPCPAADDAAGIVFALDLTDPFHQDVLAAHRRAHPTVPISIDTPKGRASGARRSGVSRTVPPTADPRAVLRVMRRMLEAPSGP